jgi:protein-tyrosine-phosphatase
LHSGGGFRVLLVKTALFVCVHNAGRSQMAEAFVNHLAKERGLNLRAESAGTVSGKDLNPMAVEAMREIGVPMDGQRPKLLTQEMVDRADRVITMGCGVDAEACPARIHISEDWGLDDPAGAGPEAVRLIRDQIRGRVERLLGEMESQA